MVGGEGGEGRERGMSRASAGMKEKSMKRGRMEGMYRKGEGDEHPGENDAIIHTV